MFEGIIKNTELNHDDLFVYELNYYGGQAFGGLKHWESGVEVIVKHKLGMKFSDQEKQIISNMFEKEFGTCKVVFFN